MKKWYRTVICILLCTAVLTMSISVFADATPVPTLDPNPPYSEYQEFNEELVFYFINLILESWGIGFDINGTNEYGPVIEQTLKSLVESFLQTLPSSYTISQWIAPWQIGFDYWGNFRGNDSMLEDVRDFADWLRRTFGLTDNSTQTIVGPGYSVGDFVVYKLPITIYNNSSRGWMTYRELGDSDCYIMFQLYHVGQNDSSWYPLYISKGANCACESYFLNLDGTTTYAGGAFLNGHNTNSTIYFGPSRDYREYSNGPNGFTLNGLYKYDMGIPAGPGTYNENMAFWANFFDTWNDIDETGETIGILTNTIAIPTSGVDYQLGDSITIYNDGGVQYNNIEWPDSIQVSNLPAIVSTGTVDNPGIVEFFRPISALIDMAKTPFEIMVQIIYRFPVEVNVCIMSLIGAICLLGIIKIMREH